MSKILIIYEGYEPTNLEFMNFFRYVQEKLKFEMKDVITKNIKVEDINWADVIIGIRTTSVFEQHISNYAKRLGKFWISFVDDDFLTLGTEYGSDGQGYSPLRKKALIETLRNTDILMSSNERILKKYSTIAHINRTFLSYTTFDLSSFYSPKEITEPIRLVMYVNDGTTQVYNQIVRPFLNQIAQKYPNKLSLSLIALSPDISDISKQMRIECIPHMEYSDFKTYLGTSDFAIGLAPLLNDSFSKYKYFNKFVEFTRAGITGIYTDCEVYRKVIIDGYNGILCNNEPEDWVAAIQRLVEDSVYRVELARNAQSYAIEHFGQARLIELLHNAIPELTEYHAPENKAKKYVLTLIKIRYCFFRVLGWMYTFYCCIKNRNFEGLKRRFIQLVNRI